MTEQHTSEPRQGARQVEIGEEEAGLRLDKFLARELPTVPRTRIFRLIRKGEVRVNSKRASPEQRLELHDRVRVPPVRLTGLLNPGSDDGATRQPAPSRDKKDSPQVHKGAAPAMAQHSTDHTAAHITRSRHLPSHTLEQVRQAIIYEDERVLVLDKPAGVAVHGGSGVSYGVIEALRALRPKETLELAHRLDRDTSGCLIVARKRSALRILHELLREGQVEKHYLTLVKGQWNYGRKMVDMPLRTDTRVGGERTVKAHVSGKEALTEFKPVQFFGNRATLIEAVLHTGRTHQIRVHAAHMGHPVAGDEKYGDEAFNKQARQWGLRRMFLHSHSLSFEWPQGAQFSVNTPLPPELGAVIDRLASSKR